MLTDTFLKLVSKYNQNKSLGNHLWLEIFTKYSEPKRQYHTIAHLENLISELSTIQNHIKDWESILFAVFYHDIIYKATSKSNEEDSAEMARTRLSEIGYPEEKITQVVSMILATKRHESSKDTDTNFLTDADLAILGKQHQEYRQYSENVRKEYSIYPNFLYNPRRKKALQHFLNMETIFKTEYFIKTYEKEARKNIAEELNQL